VINATPDAVWAALADLRSVAACLPGAEIAEVDGEHFVGLMRVALGPIRAVFSGRGTLARNDAAREGSIEGQGRDTGSGSLARGQARFAVRSGSRREETILEVTLAWRLSGMLAQFNRSGLIQTIVRELAENFAANLAASIAGNALPPAKPLGLLTILWRFIATRMLRLSVE
jgi:carbon-monoxide dehydrogenase small subunit